MSPPDITTAARRIRLLMKLRRSGITDRAVLGAIERIPREAFVPETFIDQAYEDIALPIGRGQTISQPLVVAAMTQAMIAPMQIFSDHAVSQCDWSMCVLRISSIGMPIA